MDEQNQHLEAIQDIRKMMERSSRFLSLSGLSGIAAGICALVGAFLAGQTLGGYRGDFGRLKIYTDPDLRMLKFRILGLAAVVLAAALVLAFYFTWRKARRDKQKIWNSTSRRLTINMAIPLVAGGLFILSMWQHNEWHFIAPACLIFYGIALVNGSKYTLGEVRYLGIAEIILGILCAQEYFFGWGLYFWAVGFGVLHIIYGVIMWARYERNG